MMGWKMIKRKGVRRRKMIMRKEVRRMEMIVMSTRKKICGTLFLRQEI